MRHRKKFNHLGRNSAHREAMLSNLACSLIEYKRIKTTLAKAKALRVYIEPILTKSKHDTTHSRRVVFSYLKQKDAITELFGDVATKIAERTGGYTRILKLNNRLGDNAEMCYIELVDYNDIYKTDKTKRKKTRRRGGGKTSEIKVITKKVEEIVTEERIAEDKKTEAETKTDGDDKEVSQDEKVETVEAKEEVVVKEETEAETKTDGDDKEVSQDENIKQTDSGEASISDIKEKNEDNSDDERKGD